MSKETVYVKTLGCKVNSYDSDELETQFKQLGYKVVLDPSQASISILNTCSVTANADKEARYLLRRFRRENPDALLVATGCYAQTDSDKLVAMGEVDLVFPNEVKSRVAEVSNEQLQSKREGKGVTAPKIPNDVDIVKENKQGHFKTSLNLTTAESSKTRAFLKIQDGCNGFCSYCLIPYARGASRSASPNDIKLQIRNLIDSGSKEVVLTGIHIGDFGEEHGSSLTDIIDEMWDWPDMIRLRISSLEPRELPEELLKVLSRRPELFCDHFHLPLQSGCDRILKGMRRTYNSQQYRETVEMARSYFPKANFGADVIPGFPGETDQEAAETIQFIKDVGLNYLHVFPYSKRPNTAAARMPGHLDPSIVKQRGAELRALSKDLKDAYTRSFFGQEVQVVWENELDENGRRIGHSNNYLEVVAPASHQARSGTIETMKIKGLVQKERVLGLPVN